MKRTVLLMTWVLLSLMANAQTQDKIAIDETNFPDKDFRNWVLS